MVDRPQTIHVICLDNLHVYEIPTTANELLCPDCGCPFGRIVGVNTTITLQPQQVYLEHSPQTWLDSLKVESGG